MNIDVKADDAIDAVLLGALNEGFLDYYQRDGFNVAGNPIYLFGYKQRNFKIIVNSMDDA